MKTIALLLFFIPVMNQAQTIFLGFKNGISNAQLIGDGYKGYHQFGYSGGISSQLKLNDHFRLQLDALLTRKGCHYKLNKYSTSMLYPYDVQLLYVELPLLLVYNYKKFILELGPGFGYLVDQQEYLPGRSMRDLIHHFDSTEKSAHTGIGVYFNKKWGMVLRYSNSVVPVRTLPSRQYNSVFAVAIFFLAGLSGN
jgi:hypothetical protein